MPNLELVKANCILDGFTQIELKSSILVSILMDEKKNYLHDFRKAISIIKDHVANLLYLFFKEKTASEICSILESCFQHLSSMNISAMFSDRCTKKSVEFKNIVDYISSYKVTYDKIASLVQPKSQIPMEIVKLFLQANMIQNLESEYFRLVLSI